MGRTRHDRVARHPAARRGQGSDERRSVLLESSVAERAHRRTSVGRCQASRRAARHEALPRHQGSAAESAAAEASTIEQVNHLAAEHSPYLLQHKNNPVDWYAWGNEAFTRARNE